MHPIQRLRELGQSVWLDFLDHDLIISGKLEHLIAEHGLSGATSNPTIFERSIARSGSYDALIRSASPMLSDAGIFEEIEIGDVRLACDLFRPVYEQTAGADGFVSIEVSPLVARHTLESIEHARRLWEGVARPNVMVKIPGTKEGLFAIEECLAEGININVTLLFSVERYREVAEAYLRALERRRARGEPIDRVASVASFFVSRIDTKVDAALSRLQEQGGPHGAKATEDRGLTAIRNAKVAYDEYERIFVGDRWERLEAAGARRQRLLWASTSTKNPAYPDLYYAEALVGPGTIDTMTLETLESYLAHGNPEARLRLPSPEAHGNAVELGALGLDLEAMTDELEEEGLRSFTESFDRALGVIDERRTALGAQSQHSAR
jgi:transaldolase